MAKRVQRDPEKSMRGRNAALTWALKDLCCGPCAAAPGESVVSLPLAARYGAGGKLHDQRGEFRLSINCSWRLEHRQRVLVAWNDCLTGPPNSAAAAFHPLFNKPLRQVRATGKGDLRLEFAQRYVLRVFADCAEGAAVAWQVQHESGAGTGVAARGAWLPGQLPPPPPASQAAAGRMS